MTDTTIALLLEGASLIGFFYLLRGSRRARIADAKAKHPATRAQTIATAAADRVVLQHGLTAWIRCTVCGHREMRHHLEPAELVDALTDPRPVCSRCTDVLDAVAEDVRS
jgi:hypothetical protein